MAACKSDAIVIFKTPFRGQQVLTLIGAEQINSSLAVMIDIWPKTSTDENNPEKFAENAATGKSGPYKEM